MRKPTLAVLGGVTAAVGSALCCAGPLVAVALGLSGAGLAATFEPLRPYFLAGTAVLLGSGFYLLHREEKNACEPGKACADPRVRRRMRVTLLVATVLALVFGAFPWWSKFVLS
jgi:mercuric ion transport protein